LEIKNTGQYPLVVLGSDLTDYLCKYSSHVPAERLLREFICLKMLSAFGLSPLEPALVQLTGEHWQELMNRGGCGHFEEGFPLFAVNFLANAKDVDRSVEVLINDPIQKQKLASRQNILLLALFDIWIGNDDRHETNYNTLLVVSESEYHLVPIDHGETFNSGAAIENGMALISYEESLLHSPLYRCIFKKPRNFAEQLNDCNEYLEQWRTIVNSELTEWLDEVPVEWNIDKAKWEALIRKNLLSDEWTKKVKRTFLEYAQILKQ
jgi:hypothetical protein